MAVGQGVLAGRDGALRRPRPAKAGRKGLCVQAHGSLGGQRDIWPRSVRLAPDADVPAGHPYLADGRFGVCPRHLEASSWVI